MARIRLYYYNSHDGGATFVYDTGVFDSSAPPGAGCLNPDAQQFASLQDLLAYANSHGETVQQVNSVQEVNAICSGQMAQPSQPSGCMGGICGPTIPGGGGTTTTGGPGPANQPPTTTSVVPSGGGAPVIPGGPSPYGGQSPSPFGGNLPGMGGLPAPSPTGMPTGGVGTASPKPGTTVAAAGFSFGQFLRGPMGVLTLVLVVAFLVLTRR